MPTCVTCGQGGSDRNPIIVLGRRPVHKYACPPARKAAMNAQAVTKLDEAVTALVAGGMRESLIRSVFDASLAEASATKEFQTPQEQR